jgi:anaerobic C4-dicarboxylate transporter DcuB
LIGTVIAAIAVIKKGKELADDPEFQARVEAGLIEDFSKKVKEEELLETLRQELLHWRT